MHDVIDKAIDKGRQEGRREGRQEGRREGMIDQYIETSKEFGAGERYCKILEEKKNKAGSFWIGKPE